MNTEKQTEEKFKYRVAWFTTNTNFGKFTGYLLGVVIREPLVDNLPPGQNEKRAWIGVASQPMGGYSPEVDAAHIVQEGAKLDVEAAEKIMLMHGGEQIYID